MIISFSGHRPDKLPNKETGYKLPNPTYNYICRETEKLLLQIKPDKCISGMALGFDQYAAFVCTKLGIPFIAAVPHIGQESIWPEHSKKIYSTLLKKAAEVVIVSDGGYTAWKMQTRNQWMINHCDQVIACWDGTPGGTHNCLQYATQQKKVIHIIDPNHKESNAK